MDYMTRYYRNLAENLKEKRDSLLLERTRRASQVIPPVLPITTTPFAPYNPLDQLQQARSQGTPVPPTAQSLLTPFDPTGRSQQTFSPRPAAPQSPSANATFIPGPGGRMVPVVNSIPSLLQNPNQIPQQTNQPPSLIARDPNVAVPGVPGDASTFGPPNLGIPGDASTFGPPNPPTPQMGPPVPPTAQSLLTPFDPTGRSQQTFSPKPLAPQAPSPNATFIPGPGGRMIPVVNSTPPLLRDPNQIPQQTNEPPSLIARDPNVPVPGDPTAFGPPVPPTAQSLLTPFDPTGRFQPTFSPAPTTAPTAAPTAAPSAAPSAAPFTGRGPVMGKKEQSSYDKMVADMMRARGMPVPILRSGKGGNYNEWRAAVDARNAAMREANIAITLRQNQMRDQITNARENLKAATEAGDQAAIDRYKQEIQTVTAQRRNLNKDTGRDGTNDIGQQLRVANELSQASWQRRQDDFKSRTGMDYDRSNPEHVRIMQNPNMSPEAMQAALSVGNFNQQWNQINKDNARKAGEIDRKIDDLTAEGERRKDPNYRKAQVQKDLDAYRNSPEGQAMLAQAREDDDAHAARMRDNAQRQLETKAENAGIDAVDAYNQKPETERMRDTSVRVGGMPTDKQLANSPAAKEREAAKAKEAEQKELDRLRMASGVPQAQVSQTIDKVGIGSGTPSPNATFIPGPGGRMIPVLNPYRGPTQTPKQQAPASSSQIQTGVNAARETLGLGKPETEEPPVDMMGNVISRARSSPGTALPMQQRTIAPPASEPMGPPAPVPPSEGGMNTPVDLNDFQSNQRQRQRGGTVTAAARTMGPNRSATPRLS